MCLMELSYKLIKHGGDSLYFGWYKLLKRSRIFRQSVSDHRAGTVAVQFGVDIVSLR